MPATTHNHGHRHRLPNELGDILRRNGMHASLDQRDGRHYLIVQSHDSPQREYPLDSRQLKALLDWGSNSANKRCYNTFASIVAGDYRIPKDFVHARNAGSRVNMGLGGYRIDSPRHGMPHAPHTHMHPGNFAPIVCMRSDGSLRHGELDSRAIGFYWKGDTGEDAQVQTANRQEGEQNVELPDNLTFQRQRPVQATPYNELITSEVYFSKEKWLECLGSHGIHIDTENKTMVVQTATLPVDLVYNLSDSELKTLAADTLQESGIEARLDTLNSILGEDFADKITMDTLNSKDTLAITLHPQAMEELNKHISAEVQGAQQASIGEGRPDMEPQRHDYSEDAIVMHGSDLSAIDAGKGWYREGRHGREVTVGDIVVEPAETEGKYRMSAIIDGKSVSHEISAKDYDKFAALDDYHRFKLLSKIFPEVDIKNRPGVARAKAGHTIIAGISVLGEVLRGAIANDRPRPELHAERHARPCEPRVYTKEGVDSPEDVASRRFNAVLNSESHPHHDHKLGI